MEREIDAFIAAAADADTETGLKRLFLETVEALGYHGWDAYRHRVAGEIDLLDRTNFVHCSYDFGMLESYMSDGMAEMCPALHRGAVRLFHGGAGELPDTWCRWPGWHERQVGRGAGW